MKDRASLGLGRLGLGRLGPGRLGLGRLSLAFPLALPLAFALALAGCGEKLDPHQAAPLCTTDLGSITYEGSVKSILRDYCTGCHSSTKVGTDRNGAPAGRNFDTYAGILADAALANTRIQAGSMPPGGSRVPADNASTLQCWINQGTKEK